MNTVSAEARPGTEAAEARRLMIDVALNHSGLVVGTVVAVALVPFMIDRLGAERYGLWLAAIVLATTLRGMDFGLGSVIAREVAAAEGVAARAEVAPLVSAAGLALLGLALASALVMLALAASAPSWLALPPGLGQQALPVFALVALASVAEQLVAFLTAILTGLRRFGALNLVAVALAVVRAAAIVVALLLGASLTSVAIAFAASSLAVAAATAWLVHARAEGFLVPHLASRAALAAHLPFGLAMFAGFLGATLVWQALPLMSVALLGTGALVAVHLGQRIPLVLTSLQGRVSAVVFPAASGEPAAGDGTGARTALVTGTRLVLHLTIPATVVGLVGTEQILLAWLGSADPTVAAVFRLTLLAVLADACGAVAATVLWARGAARPVLAATLAAAAIMVTGCAGLLPVYGASAGALLLALVHVGGSPWFWTQACRALGLRPFDGMRRAVGGLIVPTLACALVTGGALLAPWTEGLLRLATAAALGPAAYLAVLLWRGATDEERALARSLSDALSRALGFARDAR